MDPSGIVTIKSQSTQLDLGPVKDRVGELVKVPVNLVAAGLNARGEIEIQDWSGGPRSFVDYFAEMARSWRGWSGNLEWNDDSGTVACSAVHDGVSEVLLSVALNPTAGLLTDGSWQLRIDLALEPGRLQGVATSVALLFHELRP